MAAIAWMVRGQDWSVLPTALAGRKPGYFLAMAALAAAANVTAIVTAMLSWRWVLAGFADGVSANDSARIFFVGQFAKYLPGKVFSFAVSIRMGKAAGVGAGRMASAWLLTLVIGLLTGATVALAAGPEILHSSAWWLGLAAVPVAAVLIRPELINEAARLAARLRRSTAEVAVRPGVVRRAVLMQLASWIAGGAHLWLVAVAMGAPAARSFPLCVGVFGLAAVAGMFAVFTTDGLGVREVILLSALSGVLPVPVAGVVALVSRLVVVLSELATAAIGLLITEVVKRRGQDSAKVGQIGFRWKAATEER